MLMFSEKHFLRCLSVEPKCQALEAPKLDEQVNDCLEKIGKDPYFGSEDAYKFQGQILDLAGPLTCLCADLLNSDIKIKKEDIILMVQRILVLVGSASDFISQKRKQILWSCLNPLIKDISMEKDGKGKGTTLFDGGFIEKASRMKKPCPRLLAQKDNPPAKHRRYSQDPTDLRRFWTKAPLPGTAAGGASANS